MKFLLDENLPPSLCQKLIADGFEARHVQQIGLNATPDFKIFNFAEQSDEIILTHDLDFSTIHAFSGKSKPSVILFRLNPISSELLHQLLTESLPIIREDLQHGAFITIDKNGIRIRKLPIRKIL